MVVWDRSSFFAASGVEGNILYVLKGTAQINERENRGEKIVKSIEDF